MEYSTMYHELFADATFWTFLFSIDQDLAKASQEKRCPSCGCRLHCADYPRKPRGTRNLPDEYRRRLSFCCARDGCRKRVTPPSVRFLGRKVYLGAVVILVSAMRQGPSPRRVHELTKLFGVSRETIYRWREFWNEHFPKTTFWKLARARLVPVFEITEFPRSLLEVFVSSGDDREGWSKLLDFLAPISIAKGLVIKVSEDSGKSAEDADRRS
jgi:hypothetical protein